MTEQLILSSFSKKTISFSEATKDLRPWNNLILDWEAEYQGFSNDEMDEPQGYIGFHVVVEIVEALICVKDQKTKKKVERPGYKLIVFQNMVLEGREWESYIVYDESFKKMKSKRSLMFSSARSSIYKVGSKLQNPELDLFLPEIIYLNARFADGQRTNSMMILHVLVVVSGFGLKTFGEGEKHENL